MNITMCRDEVTYAAGAALKLQWRISRIEMDELAGIEISVMWATDGKGDEDIGVHHFRRFDIAELKAEGLATVRTMQCQLPAAPLSYVGHLVQIHWCVRVRVFLADGREVVTEQPFHLIALPAGEPEAAIAEITEAPVVVAPKIRRSLRASLPPMINRLRRRTSQPS